MGYDIEDNYLNYLLEGLMSKFMKEFDGFKLCRDIRASKKGLALLYIA